MLNARDADPAGTPPGSRRDAAATLALTAAEAAALFGKSFAGARHVLLAVSGGGDSTALLALAAEWAVGRAGPRLGVASVEHGLRPEAPAEIDGVAALAARFGLAHARLAGDPAGSTRIEEAARDSRYAALAAHAQAVGADAIATAHTLDDQAETVLMRLAAGSGPAGLAAMRRETARDGMRLLRPFLGVPKARLIASLHARGLVWAEDPMNADPRFARPRLRGARKALAREGLTAERLAKLADRMARAEAALGAMANEAAAAHLSRRNGAVEIGAAAARLPAEIRLRLFARAIGEAGGGAIRLERLERLAERLACEPHGVATLAGARVAWRADGLVTVAAAPARRSHGAAPTSAL